MTKDEISARIKAAQAELETVRQDIINGPQDRPDPALTERREELTTEIAGLNALLDEA